MRKLTLAKIAVFMVFMSAMSGCEDPAVYGSIGFSSYGGGGYYGGGPRMGGSISIGGRIH